MPGIFLESDDLCIYVTEQCNSNCIMCPMSLASRRRGLAMTQAQWAELMNFDTDQVSHITITGGEPFLDYTHLLSAIQFINGRFCDVPVLILTNGRALSIKNVADDFLPQLPDKTCIAIPIHAPTPSLHDHITQSSGSFMQSIQAIRMLASSRARIEVRIVAHQLNLHCLSQVFMMLANLNTRIDVINLVAMEMTGCAAANRKQLWVDYRSIINYAREGVLYAIYHGIDVGLYNFPLCAVPLELWQTVKNSISPKKIRFYDTCQSCREYHACGGLFYSTYELGLFKTKPIKR